MKILLHWLILTLAVIASQYVVPGISVNTFMTAVVVAAILAFINMIIKPIVGILTLPINILTLGLFSLVLNALFFWGVAYIVTGFHVSGFQAAFFGSLIVSVLNWIADKNYKLYSIQIPKNSFTISLIRLVSSSTGISNLL